jgi:hypothetical protein
MRNNCAIISWSLITRHFSAKIVWVLSGSEAARKNRFAHGIRGSCGGIGRCFECRETLTSETAQFGCFGVFWALFAGGSALGAPPSAPRPKQKQNTFPKQRASAPPLLDNFWYIFIGRCVRVLCRQEPFSKLFAAFLHYTEPERSIGPRRSESGSPSSSSLSRVFIWAEGGGN